MDEFLGHLLNNLGTSRIATLSPTHVNSLIGCTSQTMVVTCYSVRLRPVSGPPTSKPCLGPLLVPFPPVPVALFLLFFSVFTLADVLAGCAWSYVRLRLCLVRVDWLIHYRVYSCRMRCSVVCIAWSHRVMKRLSSACVILSWLLNNCPSKPRSCESSSVSSSCSSSRRAVILTRWKNSNW